MNNNTLLADNSAASRSATITNITVFICANAEAEAGLRAAEGMHKIKIACAAMVQEVFLLKAFEAGAEGVLVVACSPEKCKRQTGSEYARRRVERTQKILDETGLGGWRLAFAAGGAAPAALDKLATCIMSYNTAEQKADTEKKLPYTPGQYAALQDKKYRKS